MESSWSWSHARRSAISALRGGLRGRREDDGVTVAFDLDGADAHAICSGVYSKYEQLPTATLMYEIMHEPGP